MPKFRAYPAKAWRIVCLMTVEPLLFLASLSYAISDTATRVLMYDKVCYMHVNDLDLCVTRNLSSTDQILVQQEASIWEFYRSMCANIPAVFLVVIYSNLVDRWSKKYTLLFCPVTYVISMVIYLVNAMYMKSSPAYMLLGSLAIGLGGGLLTMMGACFSYLSATASEGYLIIRLAFAEASLLASAAISSFASGILFEAVGYVVVYFIGCIVCLLEIIYVLVRVKNIPLSAKFSRSKEPKNEPSIEEVEITDTTLEGYTDLEETNGVRLTVENGLSANSGDLESADGVAKVPRENGSVLRATTFKVEYLGTDYPCKENGAAAVVETEASTGSETLSNTGSGSLTNTESCSLKITGSSTLTNARRVSQSNIGNGSLSNTGRGSLTDTGSSCATHVVPSASQEIGWNQPENASSTKEHKLQAAPEVSESLDEDAPEVPEKPEARSRIFTRRIIFSCREAFSEVGSYFCDYANTVLRRRQDGKRKGIITLLVIVLVAITCIYAGSTGLVYLFVTHEPLSWSTATYGYYQGVVRGAKGVCLLVILPLFKRMNVPYTIIIVIAHVSAIISLTVFSVSFYTWMAFLSAILNIFEPSLIVTARSLVIHFVELDEHGKAFGLVAALETVAILLSGAIFNMGIYPATVDIFFGLALIIASVTLLIPLVLAIWLHIYIRRIGCLHFQVTNDVSH